MQLTPDKSKQFYQTHFDSVSSCPVFSLYMALRFQCAIFTAAVTLVQNQFSFPFLLIHRSNGFKEERTPGLIEPFLRTLLFLQTFFSTSSSIYFFLIIYVKKLHDASLGKGTSKKAKQKTDGPLQRDKSIWMPFEDLMCTCCT